MDNREFFGLVALCAFLGVVLGSPFGAEAPEARKKRHKRNTNIIGIWVMISLVLAILCSMSVGWIREQNYIQTAQRHATTLAEEFAKGNMGEMMAWAKGERLDPWENSYILEMSGDEGVVMLSMGPDGKHPTDDDIRGDTAIPLPRIQEFKPSEGEDDPGIFDSIKDKFKWRWNRED